MKIAVIGHFMYSGDGCNGQAIKTRNIAEALREHYPSASVVEVDTFCFSDRLIVNIVACIKAAVGANIVILMPTKALLVFLTFVFAFMKRVFGFTLVYEVVGGWLPDYAKSEKRVLSVLRVFDVIFVETRAMLNSLSAFGLDSVQYLPNFSSRAPVKLADCAPVSNATLRFCTFSRVIKEKGILEAIEAVEVANSLGRPCVLDVYGPIDPQFEKEFQDVLSSAKSVSYRGVLSGDCVITQLSSYDCLLFPTYYAGEGFPGSLIDAMLSALPVVVSDWHFNSEIVTEGKTGFIVPSCNVNALSHVVCEIVDHPECLIPMREACLYEGSKYTKERALVPLFDIVDLAS